MIEEAPGLALHQPGDRLWETVPAPLGVFIRQRKAPRVRRITRPFAGKRERRPSGRRAVKAACQARVNGAFAPFAGGLVEGIFIHCMPDDFGVSRRSRHEFATRGVRVDRVGAKPSQRAIAEGDVEPKQLAVSSAPGP